MRQRFLMGAVIFLAACTAEEDSGCDNDALQCNEDALEICVDSTWAAQEDCGANRQICHEMGDMSHCMDDGTSMSMPT